MWRKYCNPFTLYKFNSLELISSHNSPSAMISFGKVKDDHGLSIIWFSFFCICCMRHF